jgi:preprotein translocase subunit SecD
MKRRFSLGLALGALLFASLACNALTSYAAEVVLAPSGAASASELDAARAAIEKRLEAADIRADVSVAEGQLRVRLRNKDDVSAAAMLATDVGLLVFFDPGETPPHPGEPVPEDVQPLLTGLHVGSAQIGKDQSGSYQIVLKFDEQGAQILADYTSSNVGHYLVIALDEVVLIAPLVQQPITGGEAVITGQFTEAEAKRLAAEINSGPLPVPLVVVSR